MGDRQVIKTSSNQFVMRKFRFGYYGCRRRNMKYQVQGYKTNGQTSGWKYSGCQGGQGKPLEWLDRQTVDCGYGWALTDVRYIRCNGNDFQYKFKCKHAGLTNEKNVPSSCQLAAGKNLEYLDS